MRKLLAVLLPLVALFPACSINNVTVDDGPAHFFDSAGVKGCFALYDNGQGKFTIYNLPRYRDSAYAPGATFDIVQLLVGLQTGKLRDEKDAKNEALIHQLPQLIGRDTLKKWIDSLHYGNQAYDKDTNAIDDGSLKIPADEQLGLVKKLYFNQLSFFKRPQEIVRDMMNREENSNYKLVTTVANVPFNGHTLGWVLGWVEENKHPYFFVLNLETTDPNANAALIGTQLVKRILPAMGFFEGKK